VPKRRGDLVDLGLTERKAPKWAKKQAEDAAPTKS